MTAIRSKRDNITLARDVLAATRTVFPLEQRPGMHGGVLGAAAAWARCRALLEAMVAALEAGAPEATGALLRVMYEKSLVCVWLLTEPEEADHAMTRSDFVFENRHRRKVGLPKRGWERERSLGYGEEPTDDDALGTYDLKKLVAAALRDSGEQDDFIHEGYRTIYGPESFASTHATIRSVIGHIDADSAVVTERNSDSQDDHGWRLPMAIGIVLSLARGVYDEFGHGPASLDEFTARLLT